MTSQLLAELAIFVISAFLGFELISRVPNLLHAAHERDECHTRDRAGVAGHRPGLAAWAKLQRRPSA